MNERVVEILIYLMSAIRKNHNVTQKLDLLSENLIQKGYSESEISNAFTWLLDKLNYESEEIVQNQGPALKHSFRHLHEIERSVISTEAYGYIIQLTELGIIDELDVEQILERAMIMGTPQVIVEDIKSIVAAMLFTSDSMLEGGYFVFEESPIIQ
ncbi:MAG: DUF494 family protein [bacterium]